MRKSQNLLDSHKLNIKIKPELYRFLYDESYKQSKSMALIVSEILEKYIQQSKKQSQQ